MIPGIVLAAGQSARMGRSKALLPCGDTGPTFIASLIRALRDGGVDDVLVVGRPDDGALRGEVEAHAGRYVENPRHEEGQLSSLLAGLDVADRPGVHAILMMPVDAPTVGAATVRTLIRLFNDSEAPIARVVCRGRHGHPVIFARAVFTELRHADPATGARAVVRAHAEDMLNVEVDDAGVLADIDTPDEYERVFGASFDARPLREPLAHDRPSAPLTTRRPPGE